MGTALGPSSHMASHLSLISLSHQSSLQRTVGCAKSGRGVRMFARPLEIEREKPVTVSIGPRSPGFSRISNLGRISCNRRICDAGLVHPTLTVPSFWAPSRGLPIGSVPQPSVVYLSAGTVGILASRQSGSQSTAPPLHTRPKPVIVFHQQRSDDVCLLFLVANSLCTGQSVT